MDQAAALLALQETDLELIRLSKRLNELPEKAAILQNRAKQQEVGALRRRSTCCFESSSRSKLRKTRPRSIEKIDEEQGKLIATNDHREVQAYRATWTVSSAAETRSRCPARHGAD